jgi:hypothetical protein
LSNKLTTTGEALIADVEPLNSSVEPNARVPLRAVAYAKNDLLSIAFQLLFNQILLFEVYRTILPYFAGK